ncbi:ABC transporter substrate-binding protein [Rhizobium nepotum]|uniref:ABC transporter substrate-binding protein n=1 Tax=Rhizobium nepotum TaxID=1035271 RepID=UPI003CEF5039
MLKTNRRNFMMGTAAIAVASTAGAKFTFAQERRALRLGVNGLPNSLEPVNAISNVGPRIVNQIFDTLIARDFFAKGAPGNAIDLVPALAESWERIDEKSVRFKLRQKVMFHDGVELTADDVAYTFSSERLWGPEAIKKIPLGKSYSLDFDEPVVEDKYIVTLRTKTPSYLIETFVASWMSRIVAQRILQETGSSRFR